MSRSAPMRMSRATAFLDSCVLLEAKGPLFLSMVGKKEQTRGVSLLNHTRVLVFYPLSIQLFFGLEL